MPWPPAPGEEKRRMQTVGDAGGLVLGRPGAVAQKEGFTANMWTHLLQSQLSLLRSLGSLAGEEGSCTESPPGKPGPPPPTGLFASSLTPPPLPSPPFLLPPPKPQLWGHQWSSWASCFLATLTSDHRSCQEGELSCGGDGAPTGQWASRGWGGGGGGRPRATLTRRRFTLRKALSVSAGIWPHEEPPSSG